MTWIMVDIEADGPCPGLYSMISLGAIVVEPELNRTFQTCFHPITEKYVEAALHVSGFTREQTMSFPPAEEGMQKFMNWLSTVEEPRFISDNNGYDWQWVNYYLWRFCNKNPFGHSSTNLGSLYKGLINDMFKNFKHLRTTPHDHDPLNDAKGNAEALLAMKDRLGLKISWV